MFRALGVFALILGSCQGAAAETACAAPDDAEETSMLQTGQLNQQEDAGTYARPYKAYHDSHKDYKSPDYQAGFCAPLSCDAVKELCVVERKCCKKARACYGGSFCSDQVTGKPRAWPSKCEGKPPNMYGSWTFNGHRMNTYMNEDSNLAPLTSWLDNVGGNNKSASGTGNSLNLVGPPSGSAVEYVVYQDENGYFQLVIYSPAGQTRRFCAFEPWNNQRAHCPGVAQTDTPAEAQPDVNVVEIISVQEVDCDCNALSFGIVTYKQLLKEPDPTKAGVGNSFIDTVVATKVCDKYPATPKEAETFWPQGQPAPTVCQQNAAGSAGPARRQGGKGGFP